MTNETGLLAHLLNCGYADVSYFCNLLDKFDIEYSDLRTDEIGSLDVNDLIYDVFETVCRRHDINESRYNIFTNCLDSHLHIDGDEMYCEADVIKKVIEEENEDA